MQKSEEIKEVSKAMWLLQSEIQDAHKDKKGYGYNYADLKQVLEIARPLLLKYGLSVMQLVVSSENVSEGSDPNRIGLETIIMHESGQHISSTAYMTIERGKGMSLAQAAGSVITYLRRYSLAAALGITQTDDDASLQGEYAPERNPVQKPKAIVDNLAVKIANEIQGNEEAANLINKALDHYKVKSLAELDSKILTQLLNRIQNPKEVSNG